MKKIIICLVLLGLSGCASLQSPKTTNIAVSSLLDEIQIAINEIDKKIKGTSLPPFKSAELKLSTEAGKTKSGEASLVLSGKEGRSDTSSNTITLILVPNSSTAKGLTKSRGHEIADYVIAAVTAIDDKNFLKLKTLTVESGLKVVEKQSGGIEIELIGVTVKGESSSEAINNNSLKLIFSQNDKSK